ncbi:MAG: hypothetical protein RMK20_07040 [Verrucomicrobiales bacterium]|nr:hypothetical protein [Verrucomicrobiales bacterium]
MKAIPLRSPCSRCPLNRRAFLARASAAALGAVTLPAALDAAQKNPATARTRVRIIFALHDEVQPGPDWPNKGFDFRPVMQRITGELSRRCREVEFLTTKAANEEQARQILAADQATGDVDGYIVYQMNAWNRVIQPVAASGKPVLFADFPYGGSGGFLVYNAALLRAGSRNVGYIASSNLKDVAAAANGFAILKRGGSVADFVAATDRVRVERTRKPGRRDCKPDDVKCLEPAECLRRLRDAKLLAVRNNEPGRVTEILGIKVQPLTFNELDEAWQRADRDAARALARDWQRAARRIEGVTVETLESCAAMYLACEAVMKKHGAVGITINCLGGFYGGHLRAYPCLGFCELNNRGQIGGCECDVRSAVTMLVGTTLTQGRPGYISDPVLDIATRRIIYAHCVAPTKVFGPDGPANPFEILTHSEDRAGASMRSLLPLGYMTTSVELDEGKKEILLHRARAVANDPDDRACRTKLAAEPVGDNEKLFREWDRWGWHRVTFYGDLLEPFRALGRALGWKVTEEA